MMCRFGTIQNGSTLLLGNEKFFIVCSFTELPLLATRGDFLLGNCLVFFSFVFHIFNC